MDKIRISQIAKEIGKTSKEILQKAQELGFEVKTASSAVTTEQAEELYNYVLSGKSVEIKTSKEETKKSTKTEKTTKTKKEESKLKKTKEDEIDKKTRTKTSTKDSKKESPKIATKEVLQEENPQESPKAQQESPKQDLPITPQENSTIKRTGLRIVKKRDLKTEEIPQTPIEEKKEPSKTLQDLLGNFDNDSFAKKDKKKKKEKSNLQHTKKPNQQKIDLLDNREFQSSDDEEEEGIILFDLSVQDEVNLDEEENEKRATTERIKIQRHNPFMEQGSTRRSSRKKAPKPQKTQETIQGIVNIPEEIRAYEFAEKIGRSTGDVIKVLFSLGMMVTKNDFLEKDAIEILAEEFGIQIEITNNADELDYTQLHESNENEKDLVERAPVVTIMGHVDHGKTSLLDYIRNTKIASAEAGGITQHIGAYTITKNGKQITFIDTPGHEAFSEMRARGASVTDIAIIVIAADDGIKPQTIEALNHAKAANAPIIIAVNKIDKPEANTDKVKAEAAELGFTPLEWGGEYEFVHISAKTGEGIDDLLETILLQAEILELKANPNKPARAVVIESSLEKGKGPVATLIVQNGTLKVGDSIIADTAYGRVRAISDDLGKNITTITPSGVGVITGLNEVPPAGSILLAVENDNIARDYAQKRAAHLRQKELSHSTKVSFDELSSMVAQGQLKNLPVIIKTDTQGSLEAIRGSLEKLQNDEVKVNIIHKGVGGITESDITLAAASTNCVILGFNVRPTGSVKNKAKELGIEIKTYSIIYALIDDIKALLGGLLSPVFEEENTGQAEVRETFNIAKVGTIAGCFVTDGVIQRGIKVRLIRNGVVIHTGNIASLKRFKDDAREVQKGFECGIMLENYNDIQVGDVFETYKEVAKQRTF
ncbi:translation initiation factor IF-2 [Helicobacter pullorum]|uniref:Translation initiation factor IF-2 n=1 Tax=Helicobacter pullorum TaxID=35818 RepID=A0A377PYT2_9HELI|nr:translation initiation factor IF-2 [Helicobacter pullorum]OCR04788.1 translation initiation factor IF-2 [Helicobacter pullorum]OCR07586.1 translation initiation factor IF-2 [Helicobacter pullorum]OCR09124.1 translation initiation factor IF-2 [Helicobacter pullorum]OCR12102.1 translation initiation factor IF-2 [Helicobacter pullorum]OCR14887.1 translation initiation factor IF-2 [Helicobacter pullorum]